MSFFEWFGRIAATLALMWLSAVTGILIGSRAGNGHGFEGLVSVFWGVILGSIGGFFFALWLIWGVNFLPFLGS